MMRSPQSRIRPQHISIIENACLSDKVNMCHGGCVWLIARIGADMTLRVDDAQMRKPTHPKSISNMRSSPSAADTANRPGDLSILDHELAGRVRPANSYLRRIYQH